MANNFKKLDYGKNRYSESIIYSGANGDYGISKEDFLASDPSLTEVDYELWKNWSDADYRSADRKDTQESKRTLDIDQFADTELLSMESTENEVLEELEPTPNPYTYENAMWLVDSCLTDIQKRRYLQYVCEGLSTYEISALEGCNQKSVHESIHAAIKKIEKAKKVFYNTPQTAYPRTIGEGQ